jgi:hypothetical protein
MFHVVKIGDQNVLSNTDIVYKMQKRYELSKSEIDKELSKLDTFGQVFYIEFKEYLFIRYNIHKESKDAIDCWDAEEKRIVHIYKWYMIGIMITNECYSHEIPQRFFTLF